MSALGFIAFAVLTALFYPPLLSTDNLFIISVCLVMALVFMVNPLLYLHSEGRLPIPFAKRLGMSSGRRRFRLPARRCYASIARRQRSRSSSRREIHDGQHEPESERLVSG